MSGQIKFTETGVPVLSRGTIDRLAEQFVFSGEKGDLSSSVPDRTDLHALLREKLPAFCLEEDWNLSIQGNLLGLCAFQGGRSIVYDLDKRKKYAHPIPDNTIMIEKRLLRPNLSRVYRFTLAHEMGHACFHRRFCSVSENMKKYAEEGKMPRPKTLVDDQGSYRIVSDNSIRNDHDWLEYQANAFASALLMPVSRVKTVADMLRREYTSDVEYLNELNIAIADVFDVSFTASFYRMKSLGYLPETARRLPSGVILTE